MKYSDINIFCCPKCSGSLRLQKMRKPDIGTDVSDGRTGASNMQEIQEGLLACANCHSEYSVVESIPRFCKRVNYAASFGYQWKKFRLIQVGTEQEQISKVRFYRTTKWKEALPGERILEVGCGAGRFTKIALDTGAEVYSFDLSDAVEANLANVERDDLRKRHHLFQADIYQIPLPRGMFDKIFCLGVLQHCPDVKRAYLALIPFLKPGGELVVDCYLKQQFKDPLKLKYLIRPLMRWWRSDYLFKFCRIATSLAYDVKLFFVKIPFIGKHMARVVPVGVLNYEPQYHFSVAEMKMIKALSLFDMLSPKYDQPQRMSDFRSWMESAGLEILDVCKGYNGLNARGRKPKKN